MPSRLPFSCLRRFRRSDRRRTRRVCRRKSFGGHDDRGPFSRGPGGARFSPDGGATLRGGGSARARFNRVAYGIKRARGLHCARRRLRRWRGGRRWGGRENDPSSRAARERGGKKFKKIKRRTDRVARRADTAVFSLGVSKPESSDADDSAGVVSRGSEERPTNGAERNKKKTNETRIRTRPLSPETAATKALIADSGHHAETVLLFSYRFRGGGRASS